MRVLHVFDQYRSGGFERHLDEVIREFAAAGVQQFAFAGPDPTRSPEFRHLSGWTQAAVRIDEIWEDAKRVERLIRRERIDAVHAHPFYSFLPAAIAAGFAGVPYVLTFHGIPSRSELEQHLGIGYIECLDRFVLDNASAVTAVSELVREAVIREFGMPEPGILVVRNPVRFPDAPPPVRGPGKRGILISRLDPDKLGSCRAALELFCALEQDDPGWHLEVCGEGPAETALRDEALRLGLGRLAWHGNQVDLSGYIQGSSLVVGIGRVILEGIANNRRSVLAGLDGLKGEVTAANFSSLQAANFNGRNCETMDVKAVLEQLRRPQHDYARLFEDARAGHSPQLIARQYLALLARRREPRTATAEVAAVLSASLEPRPRTHGIPRTVPATLERLTQSIDRMIADRAAQEKHEAEFERRLAALQAKVRAAEDTARVEVTAAHRRAAAAVEAMQRFSSAVEAAMSRYRSERAWNVMLSIRKAYSLLLRRGGRGRMQFLHWALRGFARGTDLHCYELALPSVFDFLPDSRPEGAAHEPTDWKAISQGRQDVVILPVFDFEFRFQRPQQVAAQLARSGHRVFWVSPTRMAGSEGGTAYELTPLRPNLNEVNLPGQPLDLYGGSLSETQKRTMTEGLARLFADQDVHSPLVVVQFPFWATLAFDIRDRFRGRILYDLMDDWQNWPAEPKIGGWTLEQERRLLASCDVLTVSSAEFAKRHGANPVPPVLVRNGVDFEFFANPPSMELLADLPRPVIGYYGAIADWFAIDFVVAAARARPQYTFVLIGQVHGIDAGPLRAQPNVRFLGEKHYRELPAYLREFDVATIPFRLMPLIRGVDPVKLYEYLSQGKPVVATRMPELEALGDLVRLADTPDQFVKQIDAALRDLDDGTRETRVAFARENTWAARTELIRAAIAAVYPKVSIIVLTYNSREYIRPFWESFARCTTYPNFELILADNASTDGTAELLESIAAEYPGTPERSSRFLAFDRNLGFAGGNNAAAREATGEYLVFLNPDVVLTRHWLTRLMNACEDDPTIGVVAPVTSFSGNETRIETDYADIAGLEEFARKRALENQGLAMEISVAPFLCVLIPRHVWEQVGELDEQFEIGMFEDDDFALRVRQAGFRIVTAEDCFVHHFGNGSFAKLPSEESTRTFDQNRKRFERKWGRTWTEHSPRGGVRPLGPLDRWDIQRFIGRNGDCAGAATPQLERLSPQSIGAGERPNRQPDGSGAITVQCRFATPGTIVRMGGRSLQTAFGSSTVLSATLPEDLLDNPSVYPVTLVNDAGVSNVIDFIVEPLPAFASRT